MNVYTTSVAQFIAASYTDQVIKQLEYSGTITLIDKQ